MSRLLFPSSSSKSVPSERPSEESKLSRFARVVHTQSAGSNVFVDVILLFALQLPGTAPKQGRQTSARGRLFAAAAFVDGSARTLAHFVDGAVHG